MIVILFLLAIAFTSVPPCRVDVSSYPGETALVIAADVTAVLLDLNNVPVRVGGHSRMGGDVQATRYSAAAGEYQLLAGQDRYAVTVVDGTRQWVSVDCKADAP